MFSQVSFVAASTLKPQDIPKTKRSIANFHPSIWKDHFLSSGSDDALKVDDATKEQVEQLKEEVRKMLVAFVRNPLEKLKLVDSIQRLGVSYHFENEIDQILEQIHLAYSIVLSEDSGADLHITALLFRLLRQQGYKISCDVFSKFIEKNGKFNESLADDTKGILSLYEAAHMRGHGEDVLEEALDFTTKHLRKLVNHSRSSLVAEVDNALKWPIRKNVSRIQTREYMEIYQEDSSHNNILLTFSKLDFNMLQKRYQKELSEITRWWKDLEVPTNFPFARDRIVEGYFWTLGAYFEPHLDVGRKILTKIIAIIAILDDIYDAYGTFEELQVLTRAIQRWDRSMVNQLPEYIKPFYTAMLDLCEDISKEIGKEESSYHIHMVKEEIKKLAESYFEEAKWLSQKYTPNYKEYMELALGTSAYNLLITVSFLGMGDITTTEVLEWLSKDPKVVKASKIITRLMDDIVSHKFEQEREHVASAVECYMEEYGCLEEEACVEIQKQVVDAWKDINEACLHPTAVPMPILMCVLNLSRVIHLLYLDEDGFTNADSRTKFLIKSLLVESVPY